MTKLSPQAKSSLSALQEKHLAYTIAKNTIETELKREANNRLASIKHERDMALRLASDSGVPKTQLGKAIGTSNYRTVQEILAETEAVMRSGSNTKPDNSNTGKAETGGVLVERDPDNDGVYKVSISNFGENSLSGVAYFVISIDGELEFLHGEAFVIPQLYRAGYEDFVIDQLNNL
jgi:hypothetical protein